MYIYIYINLYINIHTHVYMYTIILICLPNSLIGMTAHIWMRKRVSSDLSSASCPINHGCFLRAMCSGSAHTRYVGNSAIPRRTACLQAASNWKDVDYRGRGWRTRSHACGCCCHQQHEADVSKKTWCGQASQRCGCEGAFLSLFAKRSSCIMHIYIRINMYSIYILIYTYPQIHLCACV